MALRIKRSPTLGSRRGEVHPASNVQLKLTNERLRPCAFDSLLLLHLHQARSDQ
ncbi:hypothetical protein H6G68_10155 [Anabaena catenula FACHB-362]|uniref:Uncharacterized protein n=2 Tax=Anabaena TaxID=1163 RepID=A0ABR8J3D4_9NOST|nr:hypothetical protein [Anabaena catenula FACHB-362]